MASTSPASPSPPRRASRVRPLLRPILPYLVCIGGFLVAWQILSAFLGAARLPGPITVVAETWTPYISQPFFDDGGTS